MIAADTENQPGNASVRRVLQQDLRPLIDPAELVTCMGSNRIPSAPLCSYQARLGSWLRPAIRAGPFDFSVDAGSRSSFDRQLTTAQSTHCRMPIRNGCIDRSIKSIRHPFDSVIFVTAVQV